MDSRELGLNKFLVFCTALAALGSVNFGYNIGDLNIPGDVLQNCVTGRKMYGPFPSCIDVPSSTVWGVIVGSFALGALVGAVCANPVANNRGYKFVLTWGPIFSVIGSILLATATSRGQFAIGRVFVGMGAGIANTSMATYVAEISTPKARNILGSCLQFATNIGIFLGTALGLGLAPPPRWRVLLALSGVLAMINTLLFPFAVESPKWLVGKGRVDEARHALQRLRPGADVENELQDIIEADRIDKERTKSVTVMELIAGKTPDNLRHQLIVVCALMIFQQMSGINAIIFYSTTIFNRTTNDDPANIPTTAQILACVLTIVAAVFTLVGMFLGSRFGRRTLMLLSHGAMAVFCALFVAGSVQNVNGLVITMCFLYNVFFNFGAGPLPWAAAGEMTPLYAVTALSAVGGAINYLFTFAIGVFFGPMQEAFGDWTFFFFMAWNAAAFAFIFFFLPETKDRRTEDIVRVHSVGLHTVLGSRWNVPVVGEKAAEDEDYKA